MAAAETPARVLAALRAPLTYQPERAQRLEVEAKTVRRQLLAAHDELMCGDDEIRAMVDDLLALPVKSI